MQQLSPTDLKAWLDDRTREPPVLLDVREPWEYQVCQIDQSVLMPMGSVIHRVRELDPDAATVVVCHHGARSQQVALYLERQGFAQVFNLTGGIDRWAKSVDSSMPQY